MRIDEHFRDALLPLVEHSDRGVREVGDGIAVTAVGHGGAVFNTATVFAIPSDPSAAVAWAREVLESVERPYAFEVAAALRPAVAEALEAQGLVLRASMPAMVLDPVPAPPAAPEGLRVEHVATRPALLAYTAVMARGFGAPDPQGLRDALHPALLEDPRVTMLSGWVAGEAEPVATAFRMSVHGVSGIFGITVQEHVRRRGFGAAMTWAAASAGAQAGDAGAALQATDLGLPVYEQMGFRTVATVEHYGPA